MRPLGGTEGHRLGRLRASPHCRKSRELWALQETVPLAGAWGLCDSPGNGPHAFPDGRDISIGRSEDRLCAGVGGIVGWLWTVREGLTENEDPGGAGDGER